MIGSNSRQVFKLWGAQEMSDSEVVGHCGTIFLPGQCCDECKMDDLCQGCCMNDEESVEWAEEENGEE